MELSEAGGRGVRETHLLERDEGREELGEDERSEEEKEEEGRGVLEQERRIEMGEGERRGIEGEERGERGSGEVDREKEGSGGDSDEREGEETGLVEERNLQSLDDTAERMTSLLRRIGREEEAGEG